MPWNQGCSECHIRNLNSGPKKIGTGIREIKWNQNNFYLLIRVKRCPYLISSLQTKLIRKYYVESFVEPEQQPADDEGGSVRQKDEPKCDINVCLQNIH